ncbi:hypothetical protein [Pedobacter sp. JCM 36344]|uniref:hypothetical protein n=1 Tax=Pedobacter sp. JCM 36344 TaxID=3374280 RepID=UPI00397A95FE
MIISIIATSASTFISIDSKAQIFNNSQNPLSVKWRQISANGFRIIYPSELEKEAQRMANTLGYIYPRVGASLRREKTAIPLLLQNRGVIANGFVQLAPKKSEFFTTPPQQFDSQDWLNNLAVHELRHIAQFDKLTGGKTHPFPEDVYFAWFGASLPLWFFEGDAVTIETALTKAGRGRQPSWIMPYRTNLLTSKNYSYSKINLGSSKDVTPGYYQYGYLNVSNIKKQFGKDIFDSVLTDIRHRPLRLYPFSNSLKKYTRSGTKKWFNQTTELLKTEWEKQASTLNTKNYASLNKPSKYATNYFLPIKLPEGKILALKQSKAETSHFVLIDAANKKEERLFGIAYQEQPWFSYANNMITWDEIRYDARYRQRSYSVICTYNLVTKKLTSLTNKTRLFSPYLSPDAKKIVAVQIDLSNQSNLVELDVATGKTLRTLPNPENPILQTPSYDATGNLITYISVSEKGKALWITNGVARNEKLITESQQQLSRPIFFNHGVAFNAHYSGIDNIYHIDTTSNKISALSASKYGAFNATPTTATEIIFNDYQVTGYQIAKTTIDSKSSSNTQLIDTSSFVNFGATTQSQESKGNVFANVPNNTFQSKPYHSLGNLFSVHSLNPTVEDEYKGGLQLVSNNLLNTFDSFAGVDYHRDLNRFEYSTGFYLKAFYPILSATYRNRPRRNFYTQNKVVKQGDWRENNVKLQASLPLTVNSFNDSYSFSLNTLSSYTQRYQLENLPSNFIKSLDFPMEYNVSFSHSTRQAERDIAPRWAQILRVSYLHQPFDNNLVGGLFAAEGYLYFPGLARNHSFLANFNYQNSWGIRRFDREINSVYGYNNILAKSKLENTLLFNYRFPIVFPDLEIGPLAYVRNLRASLFCHYENIGTETNLSEPKTYGFELRSNMNVLRYQPNVELGGRVVFVNKIYNQNPILELILNYSF